MSKKGTNIFSKRGQITLFVIVGIIILLSLILFFFIQAQNSFLDSNDVIRVSDFVEVALVQEYVTSCLDELSRDALVLVGNQGGYTDFSTVGGVTSYYDTTNADGFRFSENSQIEIPYWHYLLSNNDCSGDCSFFSQRPRLEGTSARSIEQQIKTFINRNFAQCLQNFESFTVQGYNLTEEMNPDDRILDPIDGFSYPFELTVLFRNNDVKMTMDYPLTISKGDITDSVSAYSVQHDVPLRRMYTLASTLSAVELEYRYLESQTIELISLNSGIDKNKLPPLGGATNEFTSSVFWLVPDVQKKLQEILLVYTNAMRVEGTNNYREITFPDSPAKPALDKAFANMVIPLNDEDDLFSDLDVNYDYLDWPWYFNINSNGIMIEPDSLSIDFFPFFGIQRFRHYYDISNPVRVAVTQPDALQGAGYTFAFGLENNVRNNEPMRESYEDFIPPTVQGVAEFEAENPDPQNTLVCDFLQRNTQEITVRVVDKNTGDILPGAAVSFSCGEESCTLGTTGENGEYVGKLPICGGGYLTALKDKTVRGGVPLSTSIDFDIDQEIELETIVEKNISVSKFLVVKEFEKKFSRWIPANRYVDPDVTEEVVISFERVEANPQFDPYVTAVVVKGNKGPDDEKETVRLVPGYYEVTIQSVINEELYIPESRRKKSGEKYTIDNVSMEKFPAGDIKFDQTTQLWYASTEDIYGNTEIMFRYPASDLLNVPEPLRVVEDLSKSKKAIDKLIELNMTL